MKKLFSVLGVFALFFGLSSFNSITQDEGTVKSSMFWMDIDTYNCSGAGGDCIKLDTVVLK